MAPNLRSYDPDDDVDQDPVVMAEMSRQRIDELKKRRSIARKKIQDKYVERVTEIRKRVEKRLADENKKVLQKHVDQLDRLLHAIDAHENKQQVIDAKVDSIRNECMNLVNLMGTFYRRRVERAKSTSFQLPPPENPDAGQASPPPPPAS